MTANPFDPRTVIFARHAQHVVLIHFPIALYLIGMIFDFLSLGNSKSRFGEAAYLNLSGAAILIWPTLLTGILAWQFALEGQKLKGLLLLHLLGGIASAISVTAIWVMQRSARQKQETKLPRLRFALEVLCAGIVMTTAHLGGFVSGINS